MDGFQSLLLPILIVVVIGIVTIVGWLTWYFTRSRGRNAPVDGISAADADTSQDVRTAAATDAPAHTLAIRRDGAGEWEILVKGRRYFALAAVPDAKLRAEVAGALRTLAAFGGAPTSGARVEATRHSGSSRPAVASARPASPLTQRLNQATQTVELDEEISSTGATRRITPLHGSVPTIDFAYEINQILEELAEETPLLRDHNVVLQNVPGGGITFFVDGTVYEDRSAIPNAEIRGTIERATREWERR